MARTINEIQEEILEYKSNAQDLDALTVLTVDEQQQVNPDSTSKVSEWRLWVWIVAVAIWSLEKMFDLFREEIEERVRATRVHTRLWYRDKALAFQFGYQLPPDKDYYETIDDNAKIVKYANVRKLFISGRGTLLFKLAKDNAGNLEKLTTDELAAFSDYMNEVIDFGTFFLAQSTDADKIKMELDVYYDPELIGSNGQYLDGSGDSVLPSIKAYLKGIDFDSRLILTKLVDAVQNVRGIKYPVLQTVETMPAGGGYTAVYDIANAIHNEFTEPVSGWFELDEGNTTIRFFALNE